MSRKKRQSPTQPAPQATKPAPQTALTDGTGGGEAAAPRPRVAIVQLARTGDIVNILPVAHALHLQGFAVDFIVHRNFASILEAVSYVTPVIVDGPDNEPDLHAREAEASGQYVKVLSTQVNGNPRKLHVQCESFIVQNWARAGIEWVEKFHDLPLVFDRRDREAEALFVKELVPPPDGRPLLAFCLSGYSSPFADRVAFGEWFVNKHRERYRLLDLSDVRLPKVHHLIGLIEQADVLLTVDSLPLHLAYATGTPTIALSRGLTHYNSEPREHWIGRQFYPDANTSEGRQAIWSLLNEPEAFQRRRGNLCRTPAAMFRHRILHAVDWYITPTASEDRRRILNARRTWDLLQNGDSEAGRVKEDWQIVFHELKHGQRSSADLGDTRKLPYIRDIIDHAAAQAKDDAEIIAFTNADTLILADAPAAIREKLAAGECCYSRRLDVSDGAFAYTRAMLEKYPRHVGADLFAFRAGWWKSHRHEFPDLLLACEGWDWCCRRVLERHHPAAEIDPPVVYHERHSPVWAYQVNIHDNPGQKWNRATCEKWARDNGFANALYSDGTPYLFKPDEALRAVS